MSGHDPFDALSVTDPRPENDRARDDALLARIVAMPLAGEKRHLSRNQRIAIAVGTPLVFAGAGFTYAQVMRTDVDSVGLRPLVIEARRDVSLPPGATWSPLPTQLMPPDTYTNGPVMAKEMALMEAQCHWERYWIDNLGNHSGLTGAKRGYAQIANRMRALGDPMSEVVSSGEKAAAAARAGDTSLLRRDLALNCSPTKGGSATDVSEVELSLREVGRPAVALLLARSKPGSLSSPEDKDANGFRTLVERINRALREAGAGPDSGNVYTMSFGREFFTARFFVRNSNTAAAVVRRLAEAKQPVRGSFLIVWDGAKETKRAPLPSAAPRSR